ncbi:kinase-like domain-containing protein [Hypoxylon argillaceum]|nr:kinase-like domain-containing protein [Hypoxylon argillaceum]
MSQGSGAPNLESINKVIRAAETQERNPIIFPPGPDRSNLEFNKYTSIHHGSDTVSRVSDYGWSTRSQKNSISSKLSFNPGDLLGLKNMENDLVINSRKELATKLQDAMLEASPNDAQTWLPINKLEEICQRDVICRVLSKTLGENSPDIDPFTDYVCGSLHDPQLAQNGSLKIFAILVLIDQLHQLTHFVKADIKDHHLPFKKYPSEPPGNTYTLVPKPISNRTESEPLSFFDSWTRVEKQEFYRNQWRLLVPYFDKALNDTVGLYELDIPCIMPWTIIEEEKLGGFIPTENVGGFAKVTKFHIHPSHHAFDSGKVAVKELFDMDDAPFHREFKNLKRLQTKDHLLPLYAAFRRGDKYSFVFPWADGGSLIDLWTKEPFRGKNAVFLKTDKPTTDATIIQDVVTWVAGQFSGLTGRLGLGFLHNTEDLASPQPNLVVPEEDEKKYGIHGDIKPHNILYFEQEHDANGNTFGLFKISDFGFTGFHSALSRSQPQPPGPYSPAYTAPEYRHSAAYLSRKYDIWSLGCVMLQFLTWLISGPGGLTEFDKSRLNDEDQNDLHIKDEKFFVITEDGNAGHKHSVQSHIKKLQLEITTENYLYDCLSLIRDKMLHLDVSKRADCVEVHKSLVGFYEKCRQDTNYAADILPTFQERISQSSPRPHPPVPDITVTNHSQASDISSAEVSSRLSTDSDTPTAKRKRLTK